MGLLKNIFTPVIVILFVVYIFHLDEIGQFLNEFGFPYFDFEPSTTIGAILDSYGVDTFLNNIIYFWIPVAIVYFIYSKFE